MVKTLIIFPFTAPCEIPDDVCDILVLTKNIANGPIGGTAQSIGGPLDKQGSIGQHFNADGKIGGMVQENLANKK